MEKIALSHGSGGRKMHELIDSLFIKELGNDVLDRKGDSAILRPGAARIAFTTDTYVVDPVFFPGGDIGSLAVYGTVNDLSVCGARPLYLSCGVVVEEGFGISSLRKIAASIAAAAKRSGVKVVTGDTKVVGRGSCDAIFINTSGIGEVYYPGLSIDRIRAGDSVIVSGPIGDHAVSVMSKRSGLGFETRVKSDSAPISGFVRKALSVSKEVRFMRDPTRGGLATTLNEIAGPGRFGIGIDEEKIPIRPGVRSACELLGLDPLYMACEGRAVIIVSPRDEARVLRALRSSALSGGARAIGRVTREYEGLVYLNTAAGGKRIVDMITGEQLPRIC
jgi:hydrogenase expression/formation protein HypE